MMFVLVQSLICFLWVPHIKLKSGNRMMGMIVVPVCLISLLDLLNDCLLGYLVL